MGVLKSRTPTSAKTELQRLIGQIIPAVVPLSVLLSIVCFLAAFTLAVVKSEWWIVGMLAGCLVCLITSHILLENIDPDDEDFFEGGLLSD